MCSIGPVPFDHRLVKFISAALKPRMLKQSLNRQIKRVHCARSTSGGARLRYPRIVAKSRARPSAASGCAKYGSRTICQSSLSGSGLSWSVLGLLCMVDSFRLTVLGVGCVGLASVDALVGPLVCARHYRRRIFACQNKYWFVTIVVLG